MLSLGEDEPVRGIGLESAQAFLEREAATRELEAEVAAGRRCAYCKGSGCRLEQAAPPLGDRRGGRRAPEVVLRTCEREALEGVLRAGKSSQRDVQRARIVLLAAQGLQNHEIAEATGLGLTTVGKWRGRWAKEGMKGLRDAARSGRPAIYSAEQKAWFFQRALESARDNGVPISRWSCRELVEFAKRAGLRRVPDPATLARWLAEADIKPYRWRYWLQITDPDFETRMKDVTGIYLQAIALFKAGIPVFCVDEKTGMQALERDQPDRPTRAGKIRRRDHRYKRHGATCFIGVFHVASGKAWGRFVESRDAKTFAAFIKEVCESVPDAPAIHFVMDQLSTHWHVEVCKVVAKCSKRAVQPKSLTTGKQRKALLADDKRVVFHFTPLRASWLDQIEIWFSILSRKLLAVESFTSIEDLQVKVFEFIEYYNRYLARPFRWTYTGGPCRA